MKSKQYAKRLLSLIIASVMIVTMLPVSALAAGADDVMIEDQAETIVEEAADVSGEVVEEAAEVPDIEDSEDAAIVDGAVDEIAEADPEELTGFTDGSSLKVEGVLSGSNMQFDAQLTGLSVSAVVPAKRAAKGSYMTADIVDVSAYEDAVAKKNYGKSIAGLYGLELHFYDKKGKEIKHINTSDITVTVDGLEASSYFIGRIDNKVKKIQRGTEPTFTFTEKKAYTYVIAGLEDDGLVRASGEADGDGNKRFNLNDENVNIEVVAPEEAFADGVAMEASDVTNGTTLGAEDGDDALVGASSDEVVAAYEISFYNEEGDEQQPSKEVTVTINVPLDMTQGYELIHIADDGTRSGVDGAQFSENGVTFTADSFSVYAVLRSPIQSGQQYVIYSGTTAFAYNGTNITTASVNVTTTNGQTVVEDAGNDNIVWTLTAVYGGWYISCTQGGTTRYLHFDYDFWNGASFSLSTDPTAWAYNSTDHYLYYDGYFDDYYFRSGLTRFANNTNQRGRIYMAHVEDPGGTSTGDLDYYYYNADATVEIAGHEKGQSPSEWTDVSELAKPIPGYHFLEARANSKTGDIITEVKGKKYRKGVETGNGNDLSSIFFIYMTDYTSAGSITQQLEGPGIEKKVQDNGDGTFQIRLDITGKTNTVKHGANVVVVFDITSSMGGKMSKTDSTLRINAAISAVNEMVNTLNPGTGANQNDIDFALVEFARTATPYNFNATNDGITGHTTWTKNGTALYNRVNRYTNGNNLAASGASLNGGGTNWQAALLETARVLEDKPDNDITYVVFMTDGEPTFYIDATSVQNRRTVNDPEYYKAVPYATTIVNTGYHMWDIFCSSEATTLLSSLQEDSGADRYIKAESATAIKDAFKKVAEAMLEAIGSQNAAADDGVPQLGSFDLDTIDGVVQLSNAKYYIKPKNGTETEWTDAPPATPSDAGVEWDLSTVGTLEDGTVYSVVFDIWPSQDAYDLIADLNNKKRTYSSLSDDEKKQVEPVEGFTDKYTLKTNTSLSLSYDLYGETHNEGITNYPRDKMPLPTEKISIQKIWPSLEQMNKLDERPRFAYIDETTGETEYAVSINLTLWRDNTKYLENLQVTGINTSSDDEETVWKNNTLEVYISCGNMEVTDNPNGDGTGTVIVHERGHDYWLSEPESFSYYWDLVSDIYHPMVINGTMTMLAQVNAADVPNGMSKDNNIKYTDTTDNTVYYRFNNKVYKVTSETENTLHGTNYRRSNLNLKKTVTSNGPKDGYFEFEAVVTAPDSTDDTIWFAASANPDAETPTYIMEDWVISGATKEMKDGSATGFWYANNGATIRFKIQDGWNVRFTNLYHGTTFSFKEIDNTTDDYDFVKVEASKVFPFMDTSIKDSWYTIDTANKALITGTVVEPNNKYIVEYTNKYKYFFVYHSGADGDGNLEKRPMPEEGKTANIISNLTPNTLYGGYYLDYAGKGSYKDDGIAKNDGVAYNGWNYNWSYTDDEAQTVIATGITPVAGETYYIKEVPVYYLRNYHQIMYVNSEPYDLKGLYLISAIDDLNYQQTGFTLKSTDDQRATSVVTDMIIQNAATGKSVTLKANTVFRTTGIKQAGEYLTYYNATANKTYFTTGSFTVRPYWITPDGIKINGISTRTITIEKMTKPGVKKSDE